jgi:hypothetical protein
MKTELMTKYVEEAVAMSAKGKNKGQIEGYMKYEHDLSTAEAKQVVAEALPESARGGSADWSDTVEFLRETHTKLSKKELIDGMCSVNGKTYLTNQHAYNYMAMAIEWAEQEQHAEHAE